MQETFKSLVRLPAAITVFGIEQVQTVVGSEETRKSADRLCEVVDGITEAVSAKIDEAGPAIDNISNMSQNIVDRTFENTAGMVKTTSDWLYEMMKPVSSKRGGR